MVLENVSYCVGEESCRTIWGIVVYVFMITLLTALISNSLRFMEAS